MPLVGQQDVSQTLPPCSQFMRSCPNDDPRPTFNHYLHCPFNNHSTPLHNFNCGSMRWIPVIVNCLIDTIFWGHIISFYTRCNTLKGNDRKFRKSIVFNDSPCSISYAVSCKTSSLPSLIEAKLRPLYGSLFYSVTHSYSYKAA